MALPWPSHDPPWPAPWPQTAQHAGPPPTKQLRLRLTFMVTLALALRVQIVVGLNSCRVRVIEQAKVGLVRLGPGPYSGPWFGWFGSLGLG